jgi:hypothetical protein
MKINFCCKINAIQKSYGHKTYQVNFLRLVKKQFIGQPIFRGEIFVLSLKENITVLRIPGYFLYQHRYLYWNQLGRTVFQIRIQLFK